MDPFVLREDCICHRPQCCCWRCKRCGAVCYGFHACLLSIGKPAHQLIRELPDQNFTDAVDRVLKDTMATDTDPVASMQRQIKTLQDENNRLKTPGTYSESLSVECARLKAEKAALENTVQMQANQETIQRDINLELRREIDAARALTVKIDEQCRMQAAIDWARIQDALAQRDRYRRVAHTAINALLSSGAISEVDAKCMYAEAVTPVTTLDDPPT